MIDQQKILGGATLMVGAVALSYASWELVSIGTVLILLFGLSYLVGYLAENIRFISAALLTASVVVSRGGSAVETDWTHSFTSLVLLAGFIGAAGAQIGRIMRQAIER